MKENVHQISNDYKVHDQVLKTSILSLSDKLQPFFIGPYTIEQVHTIHQWHMHHLTLPKQTERMSIHLKPYPMRLITVWSVGPI